MLRQFALALIAVLPIAVWAQVPAEASVPIQNLSQCLSDNTTGRDRKDLARWMFIAMASHPELQKYASGEAAASAESMNKAMAELLTRLLVQTCLNQTQAAFKAGGSVALQASFQTLGQLAMQELMSDQNVKTNIMAFQKYVDQKKLAEAMTPK